MSGVLSGLLSGVAQRAKTEAQRAKTKGKNDEKAKSRYKRNEHFESFYNEVMGPQIVFEMGSAYFTRQKVQTRILFFDIYGLLSI